MKLKNSKLCVECEELYEGQSCPKCGDEQGICLSGTPLMSLAPGRVRRAVGSPYPSGTVRGMTYAGKLALMGTRP